MRTVETKTFKHSFNKIALIILSIWLLSCSSPKVLSRSTQAIDFDSLQNIYRHNKDSTSNKTLTLYCDYYGRWNRSSFAHMVEKYDDTLFFYYEYKNEIPSSDPEGKDSLLYYSVKVKDLRISKKIKRWQQKPLVRIDEPGRFGYLITVLPVTAQKYIFICMAGYRFNNHKEKRKFRQTKALFKRISKRYYDIPKDYIKY